MKQSVQTSSIKIFLQFSANNAAAAAGRAFCMQQNWPKTFPFQMQQSCLSKSLFSNVCVAYTGTLDWWCRAVSGGRPLHMHQVRNLWISECVCGYDSTWKGCRLLLAYSRWFISCQLNFCQFFPSECRKIGCPFVWMATVWAMDIAAG